MVYLYCMHISEHTIIRRININDTNGDQLHDKGLRILIGTNAQKKKKKTI